MITEIASAADSVPDGDLIVVRPSLVTPDRSSRNTVTTRRISSTAAGTAGSSRAEASSATRVETIRTSSSSPLGQRQDHGVEPARRAADRSFTPRSRSLAVAIRLNPLTACTSLPSSGMGSVFSDSTVISASCTSAGIRVSSSTRTMRPAASP